MRVLKFNKVTKIKKSKKSVIAPSDLNFLKNRSTQFSIEELAYKLNVSTMMVEKLLKQHGLEAKVFSTEIPDVNLTTKKSPFTEDEVMFVSTNAGTMTVDQLAKAIGKPRKQIEGLMNELGIQVRNTQIDHNFSELEIRYLINSYPEVPIEDMAVFLKRPVQQVHDTLVQLRMMKKEKVNPKEKARIKAEKLAAKEALLAQNRQARLEKKQAKQAVNSAEKQMISAEKKALRAEKKAIKTQASTEARILKKEAKALAKQQKLALATQAKIEKKQAKLLKKQQKEKPIKPLKFSKIEGKSTRFWTDEQREYLKANYLTATALEMGIRLGKTDTAISQQLMRMGLKLPKVVSVERSRATFKHDEGPAIKMKEFWTPQRDEYLRQINPYKSQRIVARELGVSRHAIRARIEQLGLEDTSIEEKKALTALRLAKKETKAIKKTNQLYGEVYTQVAKIKPPANTEQKQGRKPKEDVENLEPKVLKKRGRKPKEKVENLEPKVLKKRGRKPKNFIAEEPTTTSVLPVKSLKVKLVGIENVAVLAQVSKQIYAQHYVDHWYDGGEWYMGFSFNDRKIEREIKDSNVRYYMAELNGEVVGYVKLNLDKKTDGLENYNCLEVERIYIDQRHKGKGIGKVLMNRAFDEARKLKKEYVWLKAKDTSYDAIGFYEGLGFGLIGSSRVAFEQMMPQFRGMVIMSKKL